MMKISTKKGLRQNKGIQFNKEAAQKRDFLPLLGFLKAFLNVSPDVLVS